MKISEISLTIINEYTNALINEDANAHSDLCLQLIDDAARIRNGRSIPSICSSAAIYVVVKELNKDLSTTNDPAKIHEIERIKTILMRDLRTLLSQIVALNQ